METRSVRSRTVTWEDPRLAVKAAEGRSGLELLHEMLERKVPRPPITASLDFGLIDVAEGTAVFAGEPGEHLYNPIGSVHGGWAMTLLDSAMGCAVHTTLAAGERYTTVEVKVNFVRPITVETGRVRCEGKVIHRGGTIATAEGRLVADATGKLLAHGTTTCIVSRA